MQQAVKIVWIFMFIGNAQGQTLLSPDHVDVVPIVSVGSVDNTSCGFRVHSLIVRDPSVFDYDVQLFFLVSEKLGGAFGMTVDRLYKTPLHSNDPQGNAEKIPPTDVYIAIPGVKNIFRFKQMTAGAHGAPLGSLSGILDAGTDGGNLARFASAIRTQEPC